MFSIKSVYITVPHNSHSTILCVLASMVYVALRQITVQYQMQLSDENTNIIWLTLYRLLLNIDTAQYLGVENYKNKYTLWNDSFMKIDIKFVFALSQKKYEGEPISP